MLNSPSPWTSRNPPSRWSRKAAATGSRPTRSPSISIVALSGKDGSTLEDTFPGDPEALELNEELKTESPVIYNAFVGAKIGSHLALAVPGAAAAEGAEAQPRHPQLLVVKVLSAKDAPKVLDKPEGETVTPPAGLPTVKDNDKGIPEISVEGVAAPTALVSQDLIKGTGPEVKETDTLTVNYVGVALAGGKVFDSSFDRGEKATFPLTGVIKGWTQGLTGKTVGSRVLLVIPKDLAYGDAGQGEPRATSSSSSTSSAPSNHHTRTTPKPR